jgi:V8-like Glu-specific endopeptidase
MKSLFLGTILAAVVALAPALTAQNVAYPTVLSGEFTQAFPYSMAGQLIFTSGKLDYQGSGTVVYKRSVLTAAHNCWDVDNGWSTYMEFNRARNGSAVPNQAYARRIFVFAGYQGNARRYGADSARAFSADLGGVRFPKALAGGSYSGWRADTRLLTGDSYNIALGYGADQHNGDNLLFVEPSFSFNTIYGAFLENESLTFEGGMSGGPVFAETAEGDLRLAGIIVAGSDDPPTGGIRALDAAASRFLRTYLTY